MSRIANNGSGDELAWIACYRELTGVTESQARSVYMYIGCKETPSLEEITVPAISYYESYMLPRQFS